MILFFSSHCDEDAKSSLNKKKRKNSSERRKKMCIDPLPLPLTNHTGMYAAAKLSK